MRTPAEYQKNLKNGIVTGPMLEDALFSVNKRAKNWRDKKREYNYRGYDKYGNAEKAQCHESEMYAKKNKLLSVLTPLCIHRELGGYERIRVYDYQKNYMKTLIRELYKGTVVWWNSYIDRSRGSDRYMDLDFDCCCYDPACVVYFFDYENRNKPNYRYYLFYKIGSHSFHIPVTEEEASESKLIMYDIGTLNTAGEDRNELVSVQFVDKVISLLDSGDYKLQYEPVDEEAFHMEEEARARRLAESQKKFDEYKICDIEAFEEDILNALRKELQKRRKIAYTRYVLSEEEKKKVAARQKADIMRIISLYKKNHSNRSRKRLLAWSGRRKDVRKIQLELDNAFLRNSIKIMKGVDPVTIEALGTAYLDMYPEALANYEMEIHKANAENAYIKEMSGTWKKDAMEEAGVCFENNTCFTAGIRS